VDACHWSRSCHVTCTKPRHSLTEQYFHGFKHNVAPYSLPGRPLCTSCLHSCRHLRSVASGILLATTNFCNTAQRHCGCFSHLEPGTIIRLNYRLRDLYYATAEEARPRRRHSRKLSTSVESVFTLQVAGTCCVQPDGVALSRRRTVPTASVSISKGPLNRDGSG